MTMNNDTPQVFGDDAYDYPQDAGSFPEHDGEAFSAFHGWAGWGDRVEPVAPDDDYPQPSFSPYSYEPEFPQRPGPGHPGQPGYPQDPGYAPDSGYVRHLGYPQDPGYGGDLGFVRDAGLVPLMEPLPDPQEQFEAPVQAGHGTIPAYGVNPPYYRPLPQEMPPQESGRRNRSTCGRRPTA